MEMIHEEKLDRRGANTNHSLEKRILISTQKLLQLLLMISKNQPTKQGNLLTYPNISYYREEDNPQKWVSDTYIMSNWSTNNEDEIKVTPRTQKVIPNRKKSKPTIEVTNRKLRVQTKQIEDGQDPDISSHRDKNDQIASQSSQRNNYKNKRDPW